MICLWWLYIIYMCSHYRFESAETAQRSKSDEELREQLLRRLVDRELLGGTTQILLESNIEALPLRELPPGTTSSLYLMYVAYMRQTGDPSDAASRTTFYSVAKAWRPCLRFRRKTEHSLCFECSRLKSAIHGCKEACLCTCLEAIIPPSITQNYWIYHIQFNCMLHI